MRTLTLLTVLLLTSPALAQETAPTPHQWPATLQVTATADAKGAPDMATLNAGVMSTAPTAAEAMQKNAADMTAVVDALKKGGVEAKDMQTSGVMVNPQYAYADGKAPKVTGYQVNNSVTVVLRDMTKVGDVLDVLVSQGANQISGPSFGIEKPDALLDTARAEAVQKAKARAELYAKAAGVTIKRIINISEGGGTGPVPPPMPMMRAMAADAMESTPVEPGQVGLSTSVTVTFELAQ
jgi:uncharacterized protein